MIIIVCILVIAVDQLSKSFFSNTLTLNQSIPIIKNFFHFSLVHNTGIAFGILKNSSNLIMAVTAAGLVLIGYSLKKDFLGDKHSLAPRELIIRKISIGFILGGAIGNMIDRLRLGYVVDFIDFRVWPVFNFADSFITIGAVILFWKLFIHSRKSKV
ncbi:MAG: signal peptidase II [Candidatus Omnitrophica bacterium]|nr:signal peptidase II [Candidatus Omnitrophota bacterium]MDD5355853.1 signal peptidase II [Candidatus Omnitrophota bacterium]